MKKLFLLFLPLLLFLIAFLAKKRDHKTPPVIQPHHHISWETNCSTCFEDYIVHVIDDGSNIFHYPTSPMPAKTVSHEDAKKIAAYLATLQGLKPSHPEWIIEGKLLFYGNCVGCHSQGGKGKSGYFPDLTRRPLKGFELLRHKND